MTPTDEPTPRARRATQGDVDQAVHILVESHMTYAWESWVLPLSERRPRLTQLYRADIELVALPHGEIWITDGGESVAVWLPRNVYSLLAAGELAELERVALRALGDRLHALDEVDREIAVFRRPCDWQLATMGTLPAHQGRGFGAIALEPRLRALDRQDASAGLETSTVDNVRFYRRHGFEVVTEFDSLPHGAPTTWLMRRSPAHPTDRRTTPLSTR